MGLYSELTTASGFCVELKASRVPHSVLASFLFLSKLSGVIYAHVLPSHGKFPGKLEL